MPFATLQMLGVWDVMVTGSPDEDVALTSPVLPHALEFGAFSVIVCVAGVTVTLELPVALL